MEVGEKLKAIRTKLGLSQTGLSKKIKLSRGYIGELEAGLKNPSGKVRRNINRLYRKYCVKKDPLVVVMVPEKPKLSLFRRFINWILE